MSLAFLFIDVAVVVATVGGDLSYNAFGYRNMVLLFTFLHILVMIVFILFGKTGRICGASQSGTKVVGEVSPQPSSSRNLAD